MPGGTRVDRECNEYFRVHRELKPGEVFTSTAGDMPFQKVIHTVGPIWSSNNYGSHDREDHELKLAVEAALNESEKLGFRRVAIPAISCGIYGFPIDRASPIILNSIISFLKNSRQVEEVSLVAKIEHIKIFHEELSTRLPRTKRASSVDTSGRLLLSYTRNYLNNCLFNMKHVII